MNLKIKLASAASAIMFAAGLASVPSTASAHHWDYCSCVADVGDFDYCAMIYMQTLCAKAGAPTTIAWDRR